MVKKLTKKLIKLKLFQTKVTTFVFAFIGVFTLSFISYFLYFQISEPKNVDEILPAENLILFSEFSNTDFAEFIEENKEFQSQIIDPFLKQYLNKNLTEFSKQAKEWLGDKSAFASYASTENNKDNTYYLFLENNNQKKALAFLRSLGIQGEELTTEKYNKFNILSFSQSLNVDCGFLYGYLVCSNEKDALKKLIDLNQAELGFLSGLEKYNKVKNNLPKTAGGSLYFNLEKFDFSEYELYLGPLKEYLQEGGISFTQIGQGIRLNSYLALQKGLVSTGSVVTKNKLDTFVNAENLGFYLAGSNLTESFKQILKVWDEVTPYFAIIIEGMFRAQIADYFGTEISLEEDIYPLFKNTYALEINLTPIPQLKMILEVEDEDEASVILKKLSQGVYLKNAKLKSENRETALKDGSVVKELLVNESKVQEIQTDFNDIVINSVEIEGKPFSFAYAIYDKKVFISTSKFAVQENLNLIDEADKSLAKNTNYLNAKKSMYLEGEESSFFDLQKISLFLEMLGIQNQQTALLSTFDYAFFSTKWFDDGMANEAILLKEKVAK